MNEELISSKPQHFDPRQESIVQAYCAGVEEKLRAAQSDDEATRIIESVCGKFNAACESELLRSMLRGYLDDLMVNVRRSGNK